MAITMQYIYDTYKTGYSLTLLAGEDGLNRPVSWVYYSEDRETTSFLYGNELIITTGILSQSPHWLLLFCQSMIEHQASGLIVNTGRYIDAVPQEVVDYCRAKHFPLLSMPWEIHIIDVSRSICGKIQEEEKTQYIVSNAFLNAIFYPSEKHMYESVLIQHGFLPESAYYPVCISGGMDQLSRVKPHLSELLRFHGMKFCLLPGGDEMILIFCDCGEEEVRAVLDRIVEENQGEELYFGVGSQAGSLYQLKDAYEKAHACALQARRQGQPVLCFSQLGLKKLLLCVHDPALLQSIIDETIAPLIVYDQLHNTEYLKVLRMYIETDSGIQEIANALFTHRNTINYRIGKIKEILHKDLVSTQEKVLFQTAFYILDLYGPEPGKTLG